MIQKEMYGEFEAEKHVSGGISRIEQGLLMHAEI